MDALVQQPAPDAIEADRVHCPCRSSDRLVLAWQSGAAKGGAEECGISLSGPTLYLVVNRKTALPRIVWIVGKMYSGTQFPCQLGRDAAVSAKK